MKTVKNTASKIIVLITAGTLLSGCVDPVAVLNSELGAFKEKDISALTARLGYPASQDFIAGAIVYTWSTSQAAQSDQQSTRATMGAMIGMWNGEPLFATDGPEIANPYSYCTLKVTTNAASTITNLHWNGDRDGCGVYRNALR
ncbi:MAG TPA: hypothetical protein VGV09_20550 [Steroidobacteraceae bacterium]|nr:hypothetical protein [Steroidobacteraceae bacterium]